jgi:Putative peptidoglycan binding domain
MRYIGRPLPGCSMRRPSLAVCFSLSCLLTAGGVGLARAGQSNTPSSSSASTQKKTAARRHRHSAKREPPGQKAPTSDRISEIQSALAREGYYQGGPTGKLDSSTIAALEKFQSANGLDSSGKLDAPTLQRLGLGSDIAGVGAPKPVVPACCSAPGSSAPGSAAPSAICCSTAPTSNPQPAPPAGASANAPAAAVPPDQKPAEK